MPANEFEKQVQDRLDDFQLSPSASVWKNVEAQIRKKKRRRVFFFLLLPLVLGLLSYSVYYILNSGERTGTAQQDVTSNKNSSKATNIDKPAETTEPSTGTKKQIIPPVDVKTNQAPPKTVRVANDKIAFTIKPVKSSTNRTKDKSVISDEADVVKDKKNENDFKNKKATAESKIADKTVSTIDKVVVTTDKPETGRISKSDTETQLIKANEKPKPVVSTPKDQPVIKIDSVRKADTAAIVKNDPVIKKKSARVKIKWGLDVSGGFTSNETQAFSLRKSIQADAAFNNSNSSAGVVAASPFPGAAGTLPPSSVKPGVGFKAGVVGELKLSKRSRISLGLQYLYASNRIKTGTADRALRYQAPQGNANFATMDQVYRGPQNNNYTNSYHFVSVPLAFHRQINKNTKTGIQWDVSVSPAYLVSTNALVYSVSNGGSYYHDEEAFNKFHLSVGTGVSLRLTNNAGMSFVLGPEVSFDTRQLMSNQYQRQQYMMYGGLSAKVLFASKKK